MPRTKRKEKLENGALDKYVCKQDAGEGGNEEISLSSLKRFLTEVFQRIGSELKNIHQNFSELDIFLSSKKEN